MKSFKKLVTLLIIYFFIHFPTQIYAAATYITGSTAAQLAAQLQGTGLIITNPVLRRGNSSQAGTFSNGIAGAKLEVDSGVILTTMSVVEAFTTNSNWQTSINNTDIAADVNLLAIDNNARYDTVVFEFDVTLDTNTKLLMVDYQFASEEYNEYVGSKFNDAFGFFVSGGDLTQTYNIARVVNDSTIVTTANIANYVPVTVNNVNNGSVGIYDDTTPQILTNSQYFINNCKSGTGVPNCTQSTPPVDVEFDGLTHRLHATLDNLTPGVSYHFKMALADTGDSQWDTGVFVNKITGIRGPQLCYDYSYKQNSRYITNKTYLGQVPRIHTNVIPNNDLDVSLYIKNVETSELTAKNLKININDIDTTQAIYLPNSVKVALPSQNNITSINDNTQGMSNTDSNIHNVPIGDLKANEHFYMYYGLTPSVGDLNISLDSTVTFYLTVQGIDTYYNYVLGSDKFPLCTASVAYSPEFGIFNMVDSQLNSTVPAGSTTIKNNIPTQVANRPTSMKIVSYDPLSVNTVKATNTMLSIERIDVGGYFDVNASCQDPNSAITKRAWVQFGEIDANTTSINFDSTLLGAGLNPNVTVDSFYGTARENTAFRISYNLGDDNGTLKIDKVNTDNYKLTNFTTATAGNTCQNEFIPTYGSSMLADSYCGSNGNGKSNSGMTAIELRDCMECIYGKKTKSICSRDNFAVRPEAFMLKLADSNIIIPATANLAAAYDYRFDINATNHLNSNSTPGYTAFYNSSDTTDRNVTFYWEPNGHIVTGCNDTNNTSIAFNMIEGTTVNQMRNHPNVGQYILNMRDNVWTAVDHDTPAHHIGTNNWVSGGDCNTGSAMVSLYDIANTYNANMVGCETSSNHTNNNTGTVYSDYNLSFRPDHFTLSPMSMSTGMTFNTSAINQNTWTYMNNIQTDANMSVRYFGKIIAHGDNNETLSNFVTNCYAQPVNLDLNLTFPAIVGLPNLRYRLQEMNTSMPSPIWRDSNAVVTTPTTATSFNLLTIPATGFLKNRNGLVDMNLSINFDRNQTLPVNPITVGLENLQVKCQTSTECRSIADGSVNHLPDVNLTTNSGVTFAYGRLLTKDIRVFGQNPFAATGWYEVFNLPAFNGVSMQPSRDGANWFINRGHDDALHGDANVTRLISAAADDSIVRNGNDNNMGTDVFNFAAINPIYNGKAHVDTAPWLWYAPNALTYSDPSAANPANAAGNDAACLTHPCFNVTVMPAIGATGSAHQDSTNQKASKTSTSGAGGGWRSINDYAPAVR